MPIRPENKKRYPKNWKQNNNWTVESMSSGWRNTDNSYHCPELGLYWQVDSGD